MLFGTNSGLISGLTRVSLGLTSFRTNILVLYFTPPSGLLRPLFQNTFGGAWVYLMNVSGRSWRPFPALLSPRLWSKGHSAPFPKLHFSPTFGLGALSLWDFYRDFPPLPLRPVLWRVYGRFSPSFPVPAKAESFNSIWVISCSEFLDQLPWPRAAPAFYLC